MKPYKKCRQNVYSCKKLPPISEEECHVCDCLKDMNCSETFCINRALQIECHPELCPCGDTCQNQRLQKRQYCPLQRVYTANRGCGMIAQQPIPAGALVIEYVGEVIDKKTFQERMIANAMNKEENYYMFQLNRNLIIDAMYMGNESRFINHSCDPNCSTEIWTVANGEVRFTLML